MSEKASTDYGDGHADQIENGGIRQPGAAHGVDDPSYIDHRDNDDRADAAKGRNSEKIDGKYWLSINYLGTLFAIGMAFMSGIGGYGLIAPVLTEINKDNGPDPNINWVPLANLTCGAVFFLLVGQLSDIFGRRWFFIFGSSIALIGIVGAFAKDVNTLIAAEVLIGVAVAFQQSFFWVVAEIVPMKYRYLANSYCYLMTTPTSLLAARVAYSFLTYPHGWRNCFYFLIPINAVSVASWYLFYHPPTFSMLHRQKLAKDLFIHFDWIGLILYSGGLAIFIFGLNWGGVLYPWKSANVIATMAIGGLTLIAALPAYEIWVHKRGKEPYLPLHLFKNIRFQSAAWNTGIAAGVYYGFSIVFPQVVTVIYYGRGETSQYDIGTLAGLAPMAFVFAQMCHGFVVWFTGPKWAMIGAAVIGCAFLTACAADIDNRPLTEALLIVGAYAMGIVESVSITTSTFPLRSQEEIGQGGVSSARFPHRSTRMLTFEIGLVRLYSQLRVCYRCNSITATLNNRLVQTVPANVYPVATRLGLLEGSLAALSAALQGSAGYEAVQGLTDNVKAAVQEPYRVAFKQAAATVFLVSLAFSGTALILSFFTTNNDKSTENYVAGNIHQGKAEKHYKSEG